MSYIASGFRRDRIWMRRQLPSARRYQVLVAVDDSASMRAHGAAATALDAVAALCLGLSALEVGDVGVLAFGDTIRLAHPFSASFTQDSGPRLVQEFTFAADQTAMASMLRAGLGLLGARRADVHGGTAMQLLIIISDGRRTPSWGDPAPGVRAASASGVQTAFIVVDSPTATTADSILDLQSVSYPGGRLTISRWMDRFPFPHYIVLRRVEDLPEALADVVRQWVEDATAEEPRARP